MPDKRVLVAVLTSASAKFLYGFRSPNESEASALGLELINTAAPSKDGPTNRASSLGAVCVASVKSRHCRTRATFSAAKPPTYPRPAQSR
jgi:hypothetical protein